MHPGETPTYLLGALLLPPTSLLLLTLLGLVWSRRRRRAGIALSAVALTALLLLSLGVIAETLIATLEPEPLEAAQLHTAQAIVVLGAGRNRSAPEWGGETVNHFALQRLRYAAHLARISGLPLLLSGGDPEHVQTTEAQLMRDVLELDYGLAPRWVESRSRTTQENAQFSAALLRLAGVSRVVVVTDAWHMPRALRGFRAVRLETIGAPTAYLGRRPTRWQHFVPTAESLRISSLALREWLALLRDALRGDPLNLAKTVDDGAE